MTARAKPAAPRGRTKRWEWLVLLLVVAAGFALRLYVLRGTDHLDGETCYRTTKALADADRPFAVLTQDDIQGHGSGDQVGFYFLNAVATHFLRRPSQAARGLSLAFGVLSLLSFHAWYRRAFSASSSLLAVTLLAGYLPHVLLSGTAMGQAGCLFFASLGGAFLWPAMDAETPRRRRALLLAAAASTALATSFRVEGWIFPFLFAAAVAARGRRGTALAFAALALAVVLYQKGLNAFYSGDPFVDLESNFLHLRTAANPYGRPAMAVDWPRALDWVRVWADHLSWPLALLACGGAVLAAGRRGQRFFPAAFAVVFLVLTVRVMISAYPSFERYSVMFGVFSLPLVGLAAERAAVRVAAATGRARATPFLVAAAFALVLVPFAVRLPGLLSDRMEQMRFSPDTRAIMGWFGEVPGPGDVVLAGEPHEALAVQFALGLGGRRFVRLDADQVRSVLARLGMLPLAYLFPDGGVGIALAWPTPAVPARPRLFVVLSPRAVRELAVHSPATLANAQIETRGGMTALAFPWPLPEPPTP